MSQVRVKSEYSFLDWFSSIEEYIDKAKSRWDKILYLTDTALHWAHDFLELTKKSWITGVIGVEIRVMDSENTEVNKDTTFSKVVLYARNFDWYKELVKNITNSYIDRDGVQMFGNYLKKEEISQLSDNIAALIPFESWFLTRDLLKKDSAYRDSINFYKKVFKDRLFIEFQNNLNHLRNNYGENISNDDYTLLQKYIATISKKENISLLPSNLTLYANEKDKESYDVFHWIGKWAKISDENRQSFIDEDHSLLSNEEINSIFGATAWDKLKEFDNLFEPYTISKINVFPFVKLSEVEEALHQKYESKYAKMDSQEFLLRYKSYKWLFSRESKEFTENEILTLISKIDTKKLDLKNNKYSPEEIDTISKTNGKNRQSYINWLSDDFRKRVEQLDYELLVVDGMWFNWYFLIVEDYINYCKDRNYPVWPGRWSAAGALLAYSLWITDVDPIKHQLLFSRFLNVWRISMPDIDTDFDPKYRDEVISYVKEKYGRESVSEVATFWTMAAKSSIKEVWKYYWENFQIMNRFAKNLPSTPWITIKDMLVQSKFLKENYEANAKTKKIIDTAMSLEKTKRQLWVHACAVMIAPRPLTEFTPIMVAASGKSVTQFEAHALEDLWLLKMDFLGLENLSVIEETTKTAKEMWFNITEKTNKFWTIDMNSLDYEDKETYKAIFAKWDTTWVFQFESKWMRKYLKEMIADSFDDIVAMVALYRPGPMAFIPSYIKRKLKKEEITYLNPALETIMKSTYGICIFQEQIIQMSQKYAGFSESEADLLRRAIGKKKKDIIEQQKSVFINKAVEMWRDGAEAKSIFEDVIEPAGNYSFNKSHAVCYAVIAFQTAYLKTHYTQPFYKSLLNSKFDANWNTQDEIGLIYSELKAKGITIEKPDINRSWEKFGVSIDSNWKIIEKSLSFWLKSIKSLPDAVITNILEERNTNWPFKSFTDLVTRLPKEKLSATAIESLVCAWALDVFGDRWEILWLIKKVEVFRKSEMKKQKEQTSIFDFSWEKDESLEMLKLENASEMHISEKINLERAYLWYYYEENPINTMKKYFEKVWADIKTIEKTIETNASFSKKEDKWEILLIGYVESKEDFSTRWWKQITTIKCTWAWYEFSISIDHWLIQKDQILVGNILSIKEKNVRKNEDGTYSISNPFKFESSTYMTFESKVNELTPLNTKEKGKTLKIGKM